MFTNQTVGTSISAEVWWTPKEQLNKVNQGNKLLKKANKKKVKRNQAYASNAKLSPKDANTKTNRTGKNQTVWPKEDSNRTAQATVQAISASQVAE